jgi:hypothetical protein
MPGNRESSVWRTLAVAFGDGLAFGVGLTLTSNATRAASPKTTLTHPDLHLLADRISQIEQRIDRGRFAGSLPAPAAGTQQISKVAEAVIAAMDTRFGELDSQFESRLAELDARLKLELEARDARGRAEAQGAEAGLGARLDARIDAVRRELTAALEAQRSQMVQVHKEFAETLARLVDEQIEQTVSQRLAALQEQTRETVREESLTAYTAFGNGMEKLIDTRLQGLREEKMGSDRQIAELRARLEGHEQNLLELVLALRQSWLQAADRIAIPGMEVRAPLTAPLNNGGGAGSSEAQIAPADCDLPGFARQRAPKRLWRIPAVSCFLLATTGLLALHYLVV